MREILFHSTRMIDAILLGFIIGLCYIGCVFEMPKNMTDDEMGVVQEPIIGGESISSTDLIPIQYRSLASKCLRMELFLFESL